MVIHKIYNEYSEKFDFHFINSTQLKIVYELVKWAHSKRKKCQGIEQIKIENGQIKKDQGEIYNRISSM